MAITFMGSALPPTEEDIALTSTRELMPPGNEMERSPDTNVLRMTAEEPQPVAVQAPEREPRASKFWTSLKLTPEREAWLVDRALRRFEELKLELGLDANGFVMPNSWLAIRQRNELSYEGDYSWREALGGIFAKSNFSLGTNIRHTRYLAARVQDDLLGTTPFFGMMSSRNADKAKMAQQVEEFVQSEIDRSKVRQNLREAQKIALYRNECVVKIHYTNDATPYRGPATVLVGPDGQPILTPTLQLYVYENDNFFPHPFVEGLAILEKDPSFTMAPNQFGYQYFPDLEQTLTTYEGVTCEPIDYRCFLAPLRDKCIHKADINVHLYKKSVDELMDHYGGIDVADQYFDWWEAIGDKQPKYRQGEQDVWTSSIRREATVAEVYIRADADQDGKAEEIFLVLDVKNQKPIFYDYLANHFKRRPFAVIPGLEKVANRWYGRGIFTLGEDQELHMDAEFNRAQLKGSRNSSVTFRVREAVDEWSAGNPTVIGTDDIYDLKPGYDSKNPPLFNVNLAQNNEQALELMEISRQASDSVIGAISLKDASQSDMNQSGTATGIMNLQAASDVITKATEQDQAEAINEALELVVDVALTHMPRERLMFSKDGSELIILNREEIRALDRDVRLFLTRSRSTQLLNTSERALNFAGQYHQMLQTAMPTAKALRPLFVSMLKSLEIEASDELLPEVTDEMLAQWQAAQQAQAAAEQERANQEHAAKLANMQQAPQNPSQN